MSLVRRRGLWYHHVLMKPMPRRIFAITLLSITSCSRPLSSLHIPPDHPAHSCAEQAVLPKRAAVLTVDEPVADQQAGLGRPHSHHHGGKE